MAVLECLGCWGRHAASRISSRSSGTMVLKRLTWGTVGDTLSAVCAAHPNRVRIILNACERRVLHNCIACGGESFTTATSDSNAVRRSAAPGFVHRGRSSVAEAAGVTASANPTPMLLRRSVELTFGARRCCQTKLDYLRKRFVHHWSVWDFQNDQVTLTPSVITVIR